MIHKIYTYDDLIFDIIKINTFKNFISFKSIGKSVNHKEIFLLKAGHGNKKILVICGHHSLETIMSEFIMEYLFSKEESFYKNVSLYVIPLLNPDGTDFFTGKISIPEFISYKDRWQSNLNGIDLNHNYDAGFYEAKKIIEKEGINGPHYTKYGGNFPFSEPETKAVFDLCQKNEFSLSLAFHTQGKEIYTGYNGIFPENTEELLKKFIDASGYKYNVPSHTASHAGFKDWFIKKYNKPAFTIEAGLGKNPLYHNQYDYIKKDCGAILDEAINFFQ